MGDTDLSVEQLEHMLAAAKTKRARDEAAEQARRAAMPVELVPASPSPRKKRPRPEDFPSRPVPLAASFFDKPKSDRKLGGNDGKVELLSRPRESIFASHESAIPRGLAERIAEEKAVQAVKEKREKARQERSTGFGDLSKESKNVLLTGKKGAVELFDRSAKGKGKEKERANQEKGRRRREKEEEEDENDPVAQLFKAAVASSTSGGGIGRPVTNAAFKEEKALDVKPFSRLAKKDEEDHDLDIVGEPKKRTRNKDGTVVEEIEMGPREFEPSAEDPNWDKVEPYSGIKLRKRVLPHSTVDSLLTGRYHLTPSQIYSLARVDSRQRIDIDPEIVDSDWVVIGVLAQKGELKHLYSNPYGGKMPKDEGGGGAKDGDEKDGKDIDVEAQGKKGKKSSKGGAGRDDLYSYPSAKKRQQRFIRFDLVDFSSSRASQSGHGRLSVFLVQAETEDKAIDEDGNEVSVYKGGSGGAYEKFWKESPGAVVAIMNPQFLNFSKQYTTFTIKPTSADSMIVIGRAAHLTFCDARKSDGQVCGSWVDDRTGKFCEYHIKRALQRTGASRAETNANTASMSKEGTLNFSHLKKSMGVSKSGSSSSSKPKQPGVSGISGGVLASTGKPFSAPVPPALSLYGSTTYVTAGTRASTMSMRSSNILPSSLSAGAAPSSRHGEHSLPGLREGPSVSEEKKRMKRKVEEDKRARKELKELVRSDRGKTNGGEMVMLAGQKIGKTNPLKGGKGNSSGAEEDAEDEEMKERQRKKRRSVLSGAAARKIGFDPTARGGEVDRDESQEAKEFRSLLENGHDPSTKEFDLSAPPGPRIRSVGAPAGTVKPHVALSTEKKGREEKTVDLDEDEDDGFLVEGGTGERPKISLAGLLKR
ncbi:hypothetical protein JCM11251_007698 [Rhodosporidiobolus azoricus]